MFVDNTLKLIGAKHPLIDKEKIVSNDFSLSEATKKILIISGPNTGGKSVALKTVGILSYMNQCGLAIPVDGEAILPVFDNIFVLVTTVFSSELLFNVITLNVNTHIIIPKIIKTSIIRFLL